MTFSSADESEASVAPQAKLVPDSSSANPAIVLVADDEDTVRRVASRALGNSGFEVVLANDGQEAVERFREQSPRIDCVVLDVTMPELNGPRALEAIRDIDQGVPAILMSGYSSEDLQMDQPGLQAAFLQKPFEVGELREAVRNAIAERTDNAS